MKGATAKCREIWHSRMPSRHRGDGIISRYRQNAWGVDTSMTDWQTLLTAWKSISHSVWIDLLCRTQGEVASIIRKTSPVRFPSSIAEMRRHQDMPWLARDHAQRKQCGALRLPERLPTSVPMSRFLSSFQQYAQQPDRRLLPDTGRFKWHRAMMGENVGDYE